MTERLRGFAFLLLAPLLLGISCALPARAAEKRIALVIGVSAYQNAPALANPVNDAHDVGDALRRLDFDVEELYDPDFLALNRGMRAFGVRAQNSDVAVVYYAGHGVQVDRENYLLPVDAKLERERDLLYEAMPLSLMMGEVAQASKIGIIMLDACRNNPFIEKITRSMRIAGRSIAANPGLARVDNVPRNVLVAMATKADAVAEDGSGGHSPFAAALLAHLQIPGLELGLFFRSVRDTVLKATGNRQEPYVFSSLGAEPFYFYPRPPNRPPVIARINPLELLDHAGPTPLGIPRPTDPDGDPLTVRIIGLPRGGELRVEGRLANSGELFALDRFMTATYKPDGKQLGPLGTVDMLIEDGRGGTLTASLPVTVKPSNHPPVAEAPRTLRLAPTALAIAPPADPDGDPLTVTLTELPRGVVRLDAAPVKPGDKLRPEDLARLSIMPEAGLTGPAGSLRYKVEDGRGGSVEGRVDIDVADRPGATPQLAAVPLPAEPAPPPTAPPAAQAAPVAAAAPIEPPVAAQAAPPAAAAGEKLALLQPPAPSPLPREVVPIPLPPAPVPPVAAGPAKAGEDGAFRDCPDCPWMVHVPAGSFEMGQGANEPEGHPAHRVTLRGFAFGKFPVTVGEWKQCLADKACRFMPRMARVSDSTPLHNVSWEDTQSFLDWLSRKAGHKYRLPSEAEWEYAARGGTSTRYWWGSQVGVFLANCTECGGKQDVHAPLPVDTFKPNPFGLVDMLGGVAQWTADCWFPNYQGAPADGSPREAHDCMKRVLRGGSFRSGRDDIQVTSRGNYDAPVRYIVNGFRVARDE